MRRPVEATGATVDMVRTIEGGPNGTERNDAGVTDITHEVTKSPRRGSHPAMGLDESEILRRNLGTFTNSNTP